MVDTMVKANRETLPSKRNPASARDAAHKKTRTWVVSRHNRDNFPGPVLREIAYEVGHHCSNPACRAPTSGPSKQKGASNVGVGAHITAAAPGGPRFDASLTPAERRSAANAIWLCNTCGRLVD